MSEPYQLLLPHDVASARPGETTAVAGRDVGVRAWWSTLLATTGVGVSAWAHGLAGGATPSVWWLLMAGALCTALVFPLVRGTTTWWEFLGLSATLQLVTHGLWATGSDVAVGAAGAGTSAALATHAAGTVMVVGLCSVAEALRHAVASWWSVMLASVVAAVSVVTGPRCLTAAKAVWPVDAPRRCVHALRGPPLATTCP